MVNPKKFLPSLGLAAVLVASVAIYWIGLSGPLLFDDYVNTTLVRVDSLSFTEIKDAALSNTSGRLRRPVSNLTLALNGLLVGQNNFSYKAVNLTFHLVCGFLVYWLTLLVVRRLHGVRLPVDPRWIGVIAAGFWLLSPIQVSTVLYVVQRMAQLSALFALLAAVLFVLWRSRLDTSSWSRTLAYVAGIVLCTLLSVFSKENGALIPLYLLILEFVVFRFGHSPPVRGQWLTGNLILSWIPLTLGGLYALTHMDSLIGTYDVRHYTLADRLLTEVHAFWHYLRLIFLPRLSEMGLYYDNFPIVREVGIITALGILGIAGLLALAAYNLRRHPVVTLGILWFFAAHALESTFIPLEPAFEHRNYLALFGPALVIAFYVPRILASAGELRKVATFAVLAIALLFGGLTLARTHSWSTLLNFVVTQSLYHPDSVRVNLDLTQHAMRANNWMGALHHIRKIEQLAPEEPAAPLLRLFIPCNGGPYEHEWVTDTREALKKYGNYRMTILAFQSLVEAKVGDECENLPTPLLVDLLDTARSHPDVEDEPGTRSLFLLMKARLQVKQSHYGQAAQTYFASYRANPSRLTPLFELASLQIELDDTSGARQVLEHLEAQINNSFLRLHESRLHELQAALAKISTKDSGDTTGARL